MRGEPRPVGAPGPVRAAWSRGTSADSGWGQLHLLREPQITETGTFRFAVEIGGPGAESCRGPVLWPLVCDIEALGGPAAVVVGVTLPWQNAGEVGAAPRYLRRAPGLRREEADRGRGDRGEVLSVHPVRVRITIP